MEAIYIPTESDFKKWIKEAVEQSVKEQLQPLMKHDICETALLNRKEIAKFLRISLVTLTDWVKRGLLHIIKEAGYILIRKKF